MLKNWLKKSIWKAIFLFIPLAIGSSFSDGAILWGIRSFMDLLAQKDTNVLWMWAIIMILLTLLRFTFTLLKIKQTESWIYSKSAYLRIWFIRKLRNLSPNYLHKPKANAEIEMAFDSIYTIQNNGTVFFQGIQAILQLLVFVPVLLYISWSLTLFLFLVIVPLVAFLQRKIHQMGPEEESLLLEKSQFRNQFEKSKRLFQNWSAKEERIELFSILRENSNSLNQKTKNFSIQKNTLSIITESISVISMIFVLSFCAVLIFQNWMSEKGLVLFCSAVLLSYKPIKECSKALPQFRSIVSACNSLFIFESLPEKNKPYKQEGNSLKIKNGNFSYDKNGPIYTNLNINWQPPKHILLKGKNGAGKTTLLRLIAHLEELKKGEIILPNNFQNNETFILSQDLELPPKILLKKRIKDFSQKEKLNEFIDIAKIGPLLFKESLSGGERAKVALVWALVSPSKIILLDEPLASIALDNRYLILEKFIELCNDLDKWIILSGHEFLPQNLNEQFLLVDIDYEKNL